MPSRSPSPMEQTKDVSPVSHKDSTSFGRFSRFLFYTRILLKNDNGSIIEFMDIKYACVPFYTTLMPLRYFVISTRHGNHQCLEEGEEIRVYNSDHVPFKVKMIFYDDVLDFIVFESDIKLCDNMPIPGPINGGCRYAMLPNRTGHIYGSPGGVAGLSGGPVFNLSDCSLIGICIPMDDLDECVTSSDPFSSDKISYCKVIAIVRIMPAEAAAIGSKEQFKQLL